ncbi:MAG: hypothetical protein M0C28_25025, partial [Candidatus Moduliflexus flocculans]|nr:hypothetical protein [Candidatus Moduliflexus flocculans]
CFVQGYVLLRLNRRLQTESTAPAQWENLIEMDEAEFREGLTKQQTERPLDQPAFWNNARFNNPSQPVVGVTGFEARACMSG